jgi:hypothetical protein
MKDSQNEKYLTGEFLAKFRGKLTGKTLKSGQSFTVVPYHGSLSDAQVVNGLSKDQFVDIPFIEWEELSDVEIHFRNPADPRHPHFKEDLRQAVLVGFSLEQVMRDGDTMHGMIRGVLFAPLYRGLAVPTPQNVSAWQKEEAELAKRFNLSLEKLNPPTIEPPIQPASQPMVKGQEPQKLQEEATFHPSPEPVLELNLNPGNATPKAVKVASEKIRHPEEAVTHSGSGLVATALAVFSVLVLIGFWALETPVLWTSFGIGFAVCLAIQFWRPIRKVARIAWAIGLLVAFFVLLFAALGAV